MKVIWSDHLIPLLKSRRAETVFQFIAGAAIAAGMLAFAGLVMWLHQKGSQL